MDCFRLAERCSDCGVDCVEPARLKANQLTVDLVDKTVNDDEGFVAAFEIGDFQRYCLLEGLDDIGLTLKHEAEITSYEQGRPT